MLSQRSSVFNRCIRGCVLTGIIRVSWGEESGKHPSKREIIFLIPGETLQHDFGFAAEKQPEQTFFF